MISCAEKSPNLVLTPYMSSPDGWALRCRSRCVKRHDNSVAKKNVRSVFYDFYPEDIARSSITKRPRTFADNHTFRRSKSCREVAYVSSPQSARAGWHSSAWPTSHCEYRWAGYIMRSIVPFGGHMPR